MSEPAAILATFSDLKLIKTRKVAQLVFEVPIESVRSATEALGWPTGEQWCGIARVTKSGPTLDTGPVGAGGDDTAKPIVRQADAPPKPNPHIRRAMALAGDTGFWNYLRRVKGTVVKDHDEALGAIKTICGFASRSDLVDGSLAAASLRELASSASAWQRGAVA